MSIHKTFFISFIDLFLSKVYNKGMKKSSKTIAVIFLLFIISIFSTACKPTYHTITFEKNYFSSPVTLVLRKETTAKKSINAVKKDIEQILKDLEQKVSLTIKSSDISKFNNLNAGESIVISNETKTLLEKANDYYSLTNGCFNVGIYPLTDLWQLSSEKYGKVTEFVIPTQQQILNYANYISTNNFTLDGNTLKKNYYNETKIDLGGLGKGYAIELVTNYLKTNGYTHGYFNIGTSSMQLLDYEENWILSVKHPRKENDRIISIETKNISLSTSGDYERSYVKDGIRYCHIISPTTYSPIQTGIISVTVLGEDACFSDALTTALSVMDIESATNFIKDNLTAYKVFFIHQQEAKLTLYTNQEESSFSVYDSELEIYKII